MLLLPAATILGALDRTIITRTLEEHRPALADCFADLPPTTTEVKLAISHRGEVVSIRTDAAPELGACLKAELETVTFPANRCGCGMVIVHQELRWETSLQVQRAARQERAALG